MPRDDCRERPAGPQECRPPARACAGDSPLNRKNPVSRLRQLRATRAPVQLPIVYARKRRLERGLARSFTSCADRKSTRLNSSHGYISYAVFCLKKKKKKNKKIEI